MTTYIVINSIILFVLFLLTIYIFYWQKKSQQPDKSLAQDLNDNFNDIINVDWKVKGLMLLAFVLILVSFITPFILTRPSVNNDFNFSRTGEIGDTISGLMNPFITMSGVIVTGLAFYIQYKANLLQRALFIKGQEEARKQFQTQIDLQNRQIKVQQFESQFYEMLRLHRENVNEMRIVGYDFEEGDSFIRMEKVTEGRKVFVTMKTELECILALIKKDRKLDSRTFQMCYKLFFSGFDEFKEYFPNESIINDLNSAREQHKRPNPKIKTNQERKEFLPNVKLNFNYKPFSGHASRLGHYFRHLYLTVKSVANSDIITDYDERMKYLRILRAQLSNHEQMLLFYNWLSGYGADWENDKHAFFTEFCMIHNLWYQNLISDKFISDKVEFLRSKPTQFRKGEMFEID